MTYLADFQPLSIAKINILYQQAGFYGQIYHCVKFKRSPLSPVQNVIKFSDTLRDDDRFHLLTF